MTLWLRAHKLKSRPDHFELLWRGLLTCEMRRDDRNYGSGDYLALLEFDPIAEEMTGRVLYRRITHIGWPADQPNGIRNGFALLSLAPVTYEEGRALDGGTVDWIEP